MNLIAGRPRAMRRYAQGAYSLACPGFSADTTGSVARPRTRRLDVVALATAACSTRLRDVVRSRVSSTVVMTAQEILVVGDPALVAELHSAIEAADHRDLNVAFDPREPLAYRSGAATASQILVGLTSVSALGTFAKVVTEIIRSRRASVSLEVDGRTLHVDAQARDIKDLLSSLEALLGASEEPEE